MFHATGKVSWSLGLRGGACTVVCLIGVVGGNGNTVNRVVVVDVVVLVSISALVLLLRIVNITVTSGATTIHSTATNVVGSDIVVVIIIVNLLIPDTTSGGGPTTVAALVLFFHFNAPATQGHPGQAQGTRAETAAHKH